MDKKPSQPELNLQEAVAYRFFSPHLEDSTLIPLASLLLRTTELPMDKPFVVHCKLCGCSAKAVAHWLENGFSII
jgi:rhodanese-related sulfurtransferase